MILFEGLPGSGKSTASQQVYLALGKMGRNVCWFAEDQRPHPLVDAAQVAQIKTPRRLAEHAVAQWQSLAAEVQTSDAMPVFDAALFGMTLGTLLRAGATLETMTEIVLQIEVYIAHLAPVVVYLRTRDVDAAFDDALARRGDAWATYFAQEISRSPFALTDGQTGLGLVRSYLQQLDQVSRVAFAALSCVRHGVDPVNGDKGEEKGQFQRILGIGDDDEQEPSLSRIERLAGVFRCVDQDVTISLRVDGPDLVVDQERGARLVHVEEDRFMIQGMPVDVWFEPGPECHLRFEARSTNPAEFPRHWVRI